MIYSEFTKGLQKQYIFFLMLIGILSLSASIFFEVVISNQAKNSEIINIAGRQRMLTQRISLLTTQFNQTDTGDERKQTLRTLRGLHSLFKNSHHQLTTAPLLSNSPLEIQKLFFSPPSNTNLKIKSFITSLDAFFEEADVNTTVNAALIKTISNYSEALLPTLDKAVTIYQNDAEDKILQMRRYQWLNFSITIICLILSGIFLFQRMLKKLQSQIDDLGEAEERFRSITHSAEISVVVASDAEGIILAWNPAAERSFGYKSHEMIGKSLTLLMPERYRERHSQGLKAAYENDDYKLVGHTIELEALHKNGHEFPIELSLGSWQSKGKKYFSAIIHDISSRKAADEEREKLKKQLFTAIESMSEGFALFDQDGKLIVYNDIFKDMNKNHIEAIKFGATLEDILRTGLQKGSFPEAVGNEESWLKNRLEFHRAPRGSLEYQLLDGRWLNISEHKTADGGVVCIRRDITKRREADAELRKLKMAIEQSKSAITITDKNGIIEYVNPYFATFSGYDSHTVIGKKPSLLSSGLEPEEKFVELWEVITSGEVWHGTLQNKKTDNSVYFAETAISPIRGEEGNITHFLALQDDITEQLRMEENLKRGQKLEAVGQLAGGLAHDFNNLLAIISGNLELLQRYVADDQKAKKKVTTALKAANRGSKLTKQLLGFTRQSATQIQTLNLNKVIDEVTPLLEHSLSKNIELIFKLNDDIHHVDIDGGDFEDCLVNLTVNAKHAMPHNGKLIIETQNVEMCFNTDEAPEDLKSYVMLSVSDNGAGIPEGVKNRIFEPFFTTKEKSKGTGLGLAMVFGFIRRSNGEIRVYSEEGIGTTFKIFLPRSLKTVSSHQQENVSVEAPTGTEKILIVDDEEELIAIAESYLREAGYTVYSAPSPKDALVLLKHEKDFDLLFSDVVMPGEINGFDLALETLRLSPITRIQLTSGFTAEAGKNLIEGNVFAKQLYDKILLKPYNRFSLLQTVRKVLDNKQFFEWSSEFETRIKIIDDDHKVLISLLNRFYQAVLDDEGREARHVILDELVAYTSLHFDKEESIMEEMNYPHFKNHKQVHDLLKNYVKSEISKLENEQSKDADEKLLLFLKDWLVDHIMGMDHDIAHYRDGPR